MTFDECAGSEQSDSKDKIVQQLMAFYCVDNVVDLVLMQNDHVEKLQAQVRAKLGKETDSGYVNRIREG